MIELKKCENCNEKCLENSLKKSYGVVMCPNCRAEAEEIADRENSIHVDDYSKELI